MRALPSAGALTLQLPVGQGRLPVSSSDTPPSSGWPGTGGVLPGRAGKETAQQLGTLIGFLC